MSRTRNRKALTLNSETLRTLASADIAGVEGGKKQNTNTCFTRCSLCNTCDDTCPRSQCWKDC